MSPGLGGIHVRGRKMVHFQFQYYPSCRSLLNEEALRIYKQCLPGVQPDIRGDRACRTYVPMYFKLNKDAVPYQGQRNSRAGNQCIAKTDRDILENSEIYTIVDKMPS